MFSIRAFARYSTLRSTSRIASYSTRSSPFRPALRLAIRPNAAPKFSPRHLRAAFSTTSSRLDDAAQELGAKLQSEIQLEAENTESSTDSDSNVKAFLDQSDWQVSDRDGEQDIILRKKYDDEDITVSFSIADFNTPSVMPEDEADEAFMDEDEDASPPARSGGAGAINQARSSKEASMTAEDSVAPSDKEEMRSEEEDYDSQQAFPANVNVLIQRPDGRGALRVNLVTDNGRFTIHGVTHLPDPPASSSDPKASRPDVATELLRNTPEHMYTGPPFQQLDVEVQELLEQYLDVRGINTALALFIPDYIDVKEQKEYLGWLGRVKDFVE